MEWWHDHGRWLTAISIIMSLVGAVLVFALMVTLPADYFISREPSAMQSS